MKILNFVFLIIILFSCDNKKYILAPHVKGKLYSKTTNSPIEGVEIYNDQFSSFFMDTIKTDNEGGFITPDFVVDISDFMEKKMEVCKAYKTQLFDANSKDPITHTATKDFMESITYRAQDLGRLSGVDYAEGFVSERLLAFKNFDGIIW